MRPIFLSVHNLAAHAIVYLKVMASGIAFGLCPIFFGVRMVGFIFFLQILALTLSCCPLCRCILVCQFASMICLV